MDTISYLMGKKAGGGVTPTGTIEITSNGETNVTNYATADVNVQPDLESKSVTISTNTTTTITPSQDKDGLSSVEVTTNVPSGININGTLENKTISSNASKGDFLGADKITITPYLNSSNDYVLGNNSTLTNFQNMYDDNDDNFATLSTNNNVGQISFKCKSANDLNIPSTAKLLDFKILYKVRFLNGATYTGRIMVVRWTDITSYSRTSLGNMITYTDNNIHEGEAQYWNYVLPNINDIQNFGGIVNYSISGGYTVYLYYLKFSITYEDNGSIHTITSDGDQIVGIANENGSNGDTIQVYVPNTSN